MLDIGSPQCEATISPEMSRLLREMGRSQECPSPISRPVRKESVAEQVAAQPKEAHRLPWLSIRRDGRRPARIRGLSVCEQLASYDAKTPDGKIRTIETHIRVFVTQERTLFAQIALKPIDELAALSIYRTAEIADDRDLYFMCQGAMAAFEACSALEFTSLPRRFPGFS